MKKSFFPIFILTVFVCSINSVNAKSLNHPNYTIVKSDTLKSADYHQKRGTLKNSYLKFEREKMGRVAFLGGSITYNGGWRDSIMDYLQKRFPKTEFDFVAAGIPSMGSTSGAFRFQKDVLKNGPVDLLFEEAAVNDRGIERTESEQIRGMEGIIRHAFISNPAIDIVMMHFVDPWKMENYKAGKIPEVIQNHEKIADHYTISSIHLAKEVTDRIAHGEFTWENDFINLHPSPFGQGVYARSMIDFLDSGYQLSYSPEDQIENHKLPSAFDKFSYFNGKFLNIRSIAASEGWQIDPKWNPNDGKRTRKFYVDIPMLVSDQKGSTLKINFEGNVFGLIVTAGPDAGMLDYRIDSGPWKTFNLFTKWSQGLHLPRFHVLASELTSDSHIIELKVASTKDERSTGNAIRIKSFLIN